MSENTAKDSSACRAIIILATLVWVLTSPWTLQAFVPEPYFLRLPYQLEAMSTPNGFGQIERSLLPFYFIIAAEILGLLLLAALVWLSRSTVLAVFYLLAVIAMGGITLWRLADGLSELH